MLHPPLSTPYCEAVSSIQDPCNRPKARAYCSSGIVGYPTKKFQRLFSPESGGSLLEPVCASPDCCCGCVQKCGSGEVTISSSINSSFSGIGASRLENSNSGISKP